ncbi:hypothetical protein G6F45_007064 [Rhizopus arrhizus]|nr:hypothetical protein G6F54_006916 [Rhizopus delemar]KAG1628255.1 hypothetical protein G6F45_007064 [Rhizopus arrhizus]
MANVGIKILAPGLPDILLIICIPTAIAQMVDFLFLAFCTANIVVNGHVAEHRAIVCFDVHFARAEINSLRSQTDKLQQQLLQQTQTADPFPSLNQQPPRRNPEAMTQVSSIESAPWHEHAKIQRIKDNLIASRNQRRLQRQEAAARFLQPPSDNHRSQYIYVLTKARVSIGQRFIATIKDEFDPCSSQNLRDPKYANFPLEERTNRAFMHHCDRIERALQFIRVPVKFAVARHFFSKGWINQKTLLGIIPMRCPRHQGLVDDLYYSEDDQTSTTNEHEDNHSSSNNANSSQHSIDFDI